MDDNRVNLFLVERVLVLEGATVARGVNGQEALDLLRSEPAAFDVVLMDIQMPVMDGLTATRAIREDSRLAGLPVLAMTAGVMDEEREAAKNAGVDDFIFKPFNLEQIITRLSRFLPGDKQPQNA